MSELTDHIKRLEKLVDALKRVDKAAPDEGETLSLIDGALSALGSLEVQLINQSVLNLQAVVGNAVEKLLAERRQDLEHSARAASLPYRRLSKSDRVALFEVNYSNKKVKLTLGSEELTSFEEISGSKILQRINVELERLDASLLPRAQFFRVLKTSINLARSHGKVSEGKVKIRDLFPYIAAARQVTSDAFCKRPSAKSYVEYSLAMLAFELSRFGEHDQGWACDGERICNQGPAMSTQHEALMLPDTLGNPVQVLWVWIA